MTINLFYNVHTLNFSQGRRGGGVNRCKRFYMTFSIETLLLLINYKKRITILYYSNSNLIARRIIKLGFFLYIN